MKFITMFTLGAAFCILVVSFFGHTLYQDEKRFDKAMVEYKNTKKSSRLTDKFKIGDKVCECYKIKQEEQNVNN